MAELFEKRINRLRTMLADQQAALMTNEANIGYCCGFFYSEGSFLLTSEKAYLFVDFRYIEAARCYAQCCEVICFKNFSEELLAVLCADHIQSVIIEANDLTVARLHFFRENLEPSGITVVDDGSLDKQIFDCRIIKDKNELTRMHTAQKIAEKAYLEMLNDVKPGITERRLAARLEYLMKLYGAEDISFDLITITGKKTSLPHGVPSDAAICEGDFFTCDFGAVYEGYHSDTTRTVAVGYATDEMAHIYEIVLSAQLAARKTVKEGTPCALVDKAARDVIDREGYGEYFGHATGHGVGLAIHEAPAVSIRSEETLHEGMVITDEPGIYLPQRFGVRIEDMLYVTKDGCQNLVSLPKELIIL